MGFRSALLVSSLLGGLDGSSVKLDRTQRPLRVIRGTVVDPESRPVPGACVKLRNGGREILAESTAGPSGVFEIGLSESTELLTDSFDLDIGAGGYATTHLVRFPRMPQLDSAVGRIRLHRPRELRGLVRSQEGAPVAGARVHMWPYVKGRAGCAAWPNYEESGWSERDWGRDLPEPVAWTSSDGSYSCQDLGPGLYNLAVSAPGFASFFMHRLDVGAGAATEREVVLERACAASVRIVDASGNPIEGV
jgi:hypothetical protein